MQLDTVKRDSNLTCEDELRELKARIEAHLEDYREHTSEYDERCKTQDKLYKNTMEAIDKLTQSTQGVVDAWVTARNLQRFVKWLSSFTIVAIAIGWLATKFPSLFNG